MAAEYLRAPDGVGVGASATETSTIKASSLRDLLAFGKDVCWGACHNHPELLSLATIAIFFIYSVLAMFLVSGVLKSARGARPPATVLAPYTLAVIASNTALLDVVLHSATKWI
jgi:hypothetical protein